MPENLKGAQVLSYNGNYVSDFELDVDPFQKCLYIPSLYKRITNLSLIEPDCIYHPFNSTI